MVCDAMCPVACSFNSPANAGGSSVASQHVTSAAAAASEPLASLTTASSALWLSSPSTASPSIAFNRTVAAFAAAADGGTGGGTGGPRDPAGLTDGCCDGESALSASTADAAASFQSPELSGLVTGVTTGPDSSPKYPTPARRTSFEEPPFPSFPSVTSPSTGYAGRSMREMYAPFWRSAVLAEKAAYIFESN